MKCLKVRDLQRKLQDAGCEAVRVSGSHEIWQTPSGERIPLPCNHRNDMVTHAVLRTFRQVLTKEGINLALDDR